MIILRSIVLLQATSILTFILYMKNVNCECPISVGNVNETLNNTCDWSSWLQWNCSTCYNQNGKASPPVRKRAICCEKGLDVASCLKSCNYSNDSDTYYGNCSTHCASYPTMTTRTITTTTSAAATTTTAAAATSTPAAATKTTTPAAATQTTPAAVTKTTTPAAVTKTTTTYWKVNNFNMTDESMPNMSVNTARPFITTLTLTSLGRHVPTGLILGVVAGCIAGLLIVVGVIIWSRKKFKSPVEPEPESIERPPEEDKIMTGSVTNT